MNEVFIFIYMNTDNSTMIQKICTIFSEKLKNSACRHEPYLITPEIDCFNTIKEARGYGIPIDTFGDTSDKMVLTPNHLGFSTKQFEYHWGNDCCTEDRC